MRLQAAGGSVNTRGGFLSDGDTLWDRVESVLVNATGRLEFKRGPRSVVLSERTPATELVHTKFLRETYSLTLKGSQWNDSHLVWVSDSLPSTMSLSLYGTTITSAGLNALKSSKIAFLHIEGHGSPRPPPDLLKDLGAMKALLLLRVTDIPVTDVSVKPLANHPSLMSVVLPKAEFSATGVNDLLSLKRLKTVILTEAELSQNALRAIAAHEGGESLGLAGTGITDQDLAMLETGFQWNSVNLSGTKISASGVTALPNLPPELSIQDTEIRVTVEFLDAIEALGCQELVVRYSQCDPAALRRGGRLPNVVEPPF